MKDLKFGPILEKMKEVVVEGQVAPGCLCDCTHYRWVSNTKSTQKGCWKKAYYDAESSSKA